MQRKPNVFEEEARDVLEIQEQTDEVHSKYCGEGDVLVIEDESGRLTLTGEVMENWTLVTGAIVAVRGMVSSSGELEVSDVIFPGLPSQTPLPCVPRPPDEQPGANRYVALVSGLRVGDPSMDMLPLQLLLEHLTGQLGCADDQRQQASIVRLVVAGNATCSPVSSSETSNAVAASLDVLKKLAAAEQQVEQRLSNRWQ